MTTDPQHDQPPVGGPAPAPGTGRLAALSVLALAVAAFFGVLFLTRGDGTVAAACAVLVLVVLGTGLAFTARDRARRRRGALAEYGTFAAARSRVDLAQVRAIRDAEGEAAAARYVRAQLPLLSLPEVVQIVREA